MKKRLINSIFALIILAIFLLLGWFLYLLVTGIPNIKNLILIGFLTLLSFGYLLYFGLELYSLRRDVPIIYGALEVVIAIVTIAAKISKMDLDISSLLAIYAAFYLIVRGYDNMERHYLKNKPDFLKRMLDKKRFLSIIFGKFIQSADFAKK